MAATQASATTCRSPAAVAEQIIRASTKTRRARTGLGRATERRRLERDLHDGVQSELVALIVRNTARGIYPPALADFGLDEALRAHAARAAVSMRLVGTAPRGTEEAEEAVYFACSEAIQNVVKHAGDGARVVLRLHYHGSLVVRVSDDGKGFNPDQATEGVGLQNIRDRIEDLGGTFELASNPGCGTVLTLALPWPTKADRG